MGNQKTGNGFNTGLVIGTFIREVYSYLTKKLFYATIIEL
jgi:hypothetical protein